MPNISFSFRKIEKPFHLYCGKDDKWINLDKMYFFVFQICIFYYMFEVIELVKER